VFKIVADENIPLAREIFSPLGEVVLRPGRTLTAPDVADADLLIVRSVTPVNQALLAGSRVKFVGTCTIGTDHIDLDYLAAEGIAFSNAPGCNAVSVVEYVIAALAHLWRDQGLDFLNKKVGIIGLGMVGGRLFNTLQAMSVDVVGYDPLIANDRFNPMVSLEQVLSCDIICIHAPLTQSGPHSTEHLLGHIELASLQPGAVLINAGRGGVIDNQALLSLLPQRSDLTVVLDVFEGEPCIDLSLLPYLAIATPHIAGYSYDGKVAGTTMVYHAVCHFLNRPANGDDSGLEPVSLSQHVRDALQSAGIYQVIAMLSEHFYSIADDDRRTRKVLMQADAKGQSGEAFDQLRKQYPKRRQWQGVDAGLLTGLSQSEQGVIRALLAI
jgi:erythronate-4-phosphate dehydrogenase